MKSPRSSWTQGIWFPSICSWVAIMGIVTTSASSVVFGTYLWDPVSIVATWDGPGGRAAAFFTGVSWCIAQMGVNISATVISGANDLTSLFPKYVNIRRGVIIQAIISGWVMVPWKIIKSADSLLSFLNSLGIFLGPILVSCLLILYLFLCRVVSCSYTRPSKLPTSSLSSAALLTCRHSTTRMAATITGTVSTGAQQLRC